MPSCKRRTEWAVEKSKRTRLKLLHFAGGKFLSPASQCRYFEISAAPAAANCICTQVTRPEGVGRFLLAVNSNFSTPESDPVSQFCCFEDATVQEKNNILT